MKRLSLAGAAAALMCGAAMWAQAQEQPPATLTTPRQGLGDRITNLRSRLWGDKDKDKNDAPPAAANGAGAPVGVPAGPPMGQQPGQQPGGSPMASPFAGPPGGNAAVERLPADGPPASQPASSRLNPNGQIPPRTAAVPEPGSSRRRVDSPAESSLSPEMRGLGEAPRQGFAPASRPPFSAGGYNAALPAEADTDSSEPGEATVSSDPVPPLRPNPLRSASNNPIKTEGAAPASPFATPGAASPMDTNTAPAPGATTGSDAGAAAATAGAAAPLAPPPSLAPVSPGAPSTPAAPSSAPATLPDATASPLAPAPAPLSPPTAGAPAYLPPSTSPSTAPAAPTASALPARSAIAPGTAPATTTEAAPGAAINRSRLAAEMERLQQRLPPSEETPPANATRINEDGSPFAAEENLAADDGSAALKSLEETTAPAPPADEAAPAMRPAPSGEGYVSPYSEQGRDSLGEAAPEADRSTLLRPEASSARPESPKARFGNVGAGGMANGAPAGDGRVLSSRQTPILVVDTVGPSRIVIGKEAGYSVVLRNNGNSAAKDVVVTVKVPEWAEIVGCEAKASGFVSRGQGERNDYVTWTVGRMEPQQQEELVVRVLPKQGLPFELNVQVSHSPIASQASVEVSEPKLTMSLSGPSEVLFGKQELFRLVLSNPGTADAENVQLRLYAANPGEQPPPAHEVGTVPAGDKKIIELELTAREGGTLKIHATANASGGLTAEANESVLVRKPDLRITTRGPKFRYSGTPGSYEIVVSNPGNADARNVQVVALVPPGAKYVECSDRGAHDVERGKVSWKINSLPAGGEQILTWKCELGEAGQTRFQAACVADGGLKDSTSTLTQVEAIADLVVTVADPRGPIPVGEEMVYQIKIANRGTRRADNVSVAGYFETGVKGVSSNEGHAYRVSQGFVQYDPLPTVAPGQEIVLNLKAVATTPGNHVFKAELRCDALNTRIAVEENTMFYSDEDGYPKATASAGAGPDTAKAPLPNERAVTAPPTPRTAGRLRLP